ncbi:hypothetical protein [Geobacillus stearothermophilus]|uniref:hypothetical protein n=1 Tax=Geobacillus stearothermophilus TaxID=1422 RepID=UPI0024029847|nr:hypothetical protein [Geobacillus stearothermophilus]MDF9298505.1 hypothetical protein [Geobacillus stearothermophilus]
MGDGAVAGWISTHSLEKSDDDTQISDNLLKFYVYYKNSKHSFLEVKESFFRKKDKDLFYVNETKSLNM